MTVASENFRAGPYNGNGSTTVFSYGFRILSESHIRVVLGREGSVDAELLLGSNYTVSGVGAPGGGSITVLSAPSVGETITILRDVPFTQDTDLENQGAYYAETVENALDLLTMRDQQLQEQLDRAIKAPASSDGEGTEFNDQLVADVTRLAKSADAIDVLADVAEDIPAVAGISESVSVVAGIADAITGAAAAVKVSEKYFTGDGVTEAWELDRFPGDPENVLLWIGGSIQGTSDYSLAGKFLTVSPPVENGIEIRTLIMTLMSSSSGGGGSGEGNAATLNGQAGAFYLSRANHTGAQAISSVSGLGDALDGKAPANHSHEISQVSGLSSALASKAPLSSPVFTGDPKGPTRPVADNSDSLATTAHVKAAISAAGGVLPGGEDASTLNGQDGDYYRARANHTGTQAIATVDGLESALAGLSGSNPDYMTEAAFVAATIPGLVVSVRTAGYHAPGDGGGHRKVRISTPSPVEPWHKQSADGAWWAVAETAVCPQMFGAKADFNWSTGSGTDDTAAIRAAVSYGKKVFVPFGQYRVTGEIEFVTAGQVMEFENSGGFSYGSSLAGWQHNTAFVATGTFTKRVRTRRKHRGSAGAAQDAALSVVINIQNEAVKLIRPCIRLYCNYSNTSPSNLGDNCDVGIFVGTRVGTQLHDPIVVDYFRVAGVYFDVSNGSGMPRFSKLSGGQYPAGTVSNGGDGTHMWNPYIRGPRVGLAILGALPAAGNEGYGPSYYDALQGNAAVSDSRGQFGFSDFAVFGGKIYGPDHHSNRRLADPTRSGGALNKTSLEAEPESMPASVYIDGLAGNSSGSLWGMSFYQVRCATFEAFRVRLDRCSRIRFYGGHMEGRNGGRFSTGGVAVDTNDYALNSYGNISGTSRTGRVSWYGAVSQTISDGLQHCYGETLFFISDSGRVFVPQYMLSRGEFDIRGAGHRWRKATGETLMTLDESGNLSVAGSVSGGGVGGGSPTYDVVSINASGYMRSLSGFLDLRGATGSGVTLRSGNSTIAEFFSSGNARIRGDLTVDGSVISSGGGGGGGVLPVYTAAQIASKSHSVNTSGKQQGKMVWDSTNFRIMVAAGGASTSTWRVADGSASVSPT